MEDILGRRFGMVRRAGWSYEGVLIGSQMIKSSGRERHVSLIYRVDSLLAFLLFSVGKQFSEEGRM
jgi:hypothetical protein